MATFHEKKGWEWTAPERQVRQAELRRAKGLLAKLQEQVRRTAAHLPQFAERAAEAFRPLAEGLKQVAGMDLSARGRKYQPLAPEEVDRILASVPSLLGPWQQFMASSEVAAAVRQKNREIRTANAQVREHNQAVAAQQSEMWDQFAQVLRKVDAGDINGALDQAGDMGIL
jgi:hypothetical protein